MGLFGPLISITTLDFMSADLPAGYGSHAARRHPNIQVVSLWVSILGLLGALISRMPSDFTSAAPPAVQGSPAARRHAKILRKQQIYRYGCRFGVIWAADFDNDIRCNVRRTARRLSVTRRPPIHQYTKEMTDVSFFVSILELLGPLISIMALNFMSADLPAG